MFNFKHVWKHFEHYVWKGVGTPNSHLWVMVQGVLSPLNRDMYVIDNIFCFDFHLLLALYDLVTNFGVALDFLTNFSLKEVCQWL